MRYDTSYHFTWWEEPNYAVTGLGRIEQKLNRLLEILDPEIIAQREQILRDKEEKQNREKEERERRNAIFEVANSKAGEILRKVPTALLEEVERYAVYLTICDLVDYHPSPSTGVSEVLDALEKVPELHQEQLRVEVIKQELLVRRKERR